MIRGTLEQKPNSMKTSNVRADTSMQGWVRTFDSLDTNAERWVEICPLKGNTTCCVQIRAPPPSSPPALLGLPR